MFIIPLSTTHEIEREREKIQFYTHKRRNYNIYIVNFLGINASLTCNFPLSIGNASVKKEKALSRDSSTYKRIYISMDHVPRKERHTLV